MCLLAIYEFPGLHLWSKNRHFHHFEQNLAIVGPEIPRDFCL